MLFTCLRIDRDTFPKGMYMYEVRHNDDQQGDSAQISNWIMVNHLGTLISNQPIKLEKSPSVNNAYRDISPETDWNYKGVDSTLAVHLNNPQEADGSETELPAFWDEKLITAILSNKDDDLKFN